MKAVNGSMSGVKRALSGNMANGSGGTDYTPSCILITGGAGEIGCMRMPLVACHRDETLFKLPRLYLTAGVGISQVSSPRTSSSGS